MRRRLRSNDIKSFTALPQKEVYFPSEYSLSLFDPSMDTPFCLQPDLIKRLDKIPEYAHTKFGRAKSLFNFLHNQIKYEQLPFKSYRNGREVWTDKKGVCGEMAFLYVVCARYLGIHSTYVHVDVDDKGKSVCHACAGIYLKDTQGIIDDYFDLESDAPTKRTFISSLFRSDYSRPKDIPVSANGIQLVDIAYRSFDVKHRKFTPRCDWDAFKDYTAWRRNVVLMEHPIR